MALLSTIRGLFSENILLSLTLVQTLSVLTGFTLVFIALSYVQQFFSCRLKNVKGPLWTKFSNLDLIVATVQGRRVHRLLELHQQYGPIVRVAPNEVSVADCQYYRPLYTNPSALKDENVYNPPILGKGSLFQMTNPDQHSARRKLSNPAYSMQSITSLNPIIRQHADQMVADIIREAEASPSGTTDAYEHCGMYSFKVICKLTFAKDFAASETAEVRKLLDAMNNCIWAFVFERFMPWVRSTGLSNKLPGGVGESCRKHDYWVDKTGELVDHLLMSSTEHDKFFLSPVCNGSDDYLGRKLSQVELVAESMGVMVGGSETLSTTLTYLLYELSRPENIHVQKQLRKEILGISDDISTLRKNVYLKAVINETLRLYPSILSTLPRVLPEPIMLGEYVIPPGTTVGMQNYVHQRNPDVFQDPEHWNPDRWLDPSEEMTAYFTPFSFGRRTCIGLNLAWDELILAMNSLMRSGVEIRLGKEMTGDDMEIEDRFAALPKARKLILEVVRV